MEDEKEEEKEEEEEEEEEEEKEEEEEEVDSVEEGTRPELGVSVRDSLCCRVPTCKTNKMINRWFGTAQVGSRHTRHGARGFLGGSRGGA